MAIIFFQIADKNCFTTTQIVILWIFMALVTAVDYITPIIWTKKCDEQNDEQDEVQFD